MWKVLQISSLWPFCIFVLKFLCLIFFWLWVFYFLCFFLGSSACLATCVDPIQWKKNQDYQSKSNVGFCVCSWDLIHLNGSVLSLTTWSSFHQALFICAHNLPSLFFFFKGIFFFEGFCEGFQEILRVWSSPWLKNELAVESFWFVSFFFLSKPFYWEIFLQGLGFGSSHLSFLLSSLMVIWNCESSLFFLKF